MSQCLIVFVVLLINVHAKSIPESQVSGPEKGDENLHDILDCSGNVLTTECKMICENEKFKPLCTKQSLHLCICEYPSQKDTSKDERMALVIKMDSSQTNGLDQSQQISLNDFDNASNVNKMTAPESNDVSAQEIAEKSLNDVDNVSNVNKMNAQGRNDGNAQEIAQKNLNNLKNNEDKTIRDENNTGVKEHANKKEITALTEVHPQPNIAALNHTGNKASWSVKSFLERTKDKDNKQENANGQHEGKKINSNAKLDAADVDTADSMETDKGSGNDASIPSKPTDEKINLAKEKQIETQINKNIQMEVNKNLLGPKIPSKDISDSEKKNKHDTGKSEVNEEHPLTKSNNKMLAQNFKEIENPDKKVDQKENIKQDPIKAEIDKTKNNNRESSGNKIQTVNKDNELIKAFNGPEKEKVIEDDVSEMPAGDNFKKSSDLDLYISNQTFITSGVFIYLVLCMLFLYLRSYRKKKYKRVPLLQHEDSNEL